MWTKKKKKKKKKSMKHFSYFFLSFDNAYFLKKNMEIIINMSSAEYSQRVVMVNKRAQRALIRSPVSLSLVYSKRL